MKIVRILGGLGNQMFQYAFYSALKESNTNVFADLSLFESYTKHNGYELKRIFNINIKQPPKFWVQLLKPEQKKGKYVKLKKILFLKDSYLEEPLDFKYQNDFLTKKGIHYYWGYWQNEKYFGNIRAKLLNDFTFPPFNNEKNKVLLTKIKNYESVSLHVRRGDYLHEEGLGNICDLNYYQSAINYITNKINYPHFFVFSDDIQWCKSKFKGDNFTFIDWNIGDESYIDMQLMSNCKHNIIANSSFSWWGAWLNQHPEKYIIAPSKWMKNSELTPVLKEWKRL